MLPSRRCADQVLLALVWVLAKVAASSTHALSGSADSGSVGLPPTSRRSFLAKASARGGHAQAPKVCMDSPVGWNDLTLNSCEDYGDKQFCTADGGYGAGWDQLTWGPFSRYSLTKTATEACCVCGGGVEGVAAGCTSFTCPSGFSQKADVASLYCKSFKCDLGDDLETCCEAPPDVQAAVTQTKALIETLKEEVKTNISSQGGTMLKALAADADKGKTDKVGALQTSWGAARKDEIAKTKDRFDAQTAGSDQFATAAAHEIAVTGYVAARDEMDDKATVDQAKLQALLTHATASFDNSQVVWKSAIKQSLTVQKLAEREWNAHHADLNATWPLVVKGINELNSAIDLSAKPGNDVRWAEQSARLASDLTQTAKSNSLGLMSQAEAAEVRANVALDLTGSNSGKLDELEAMVDRLGSSVGR